MDIKILGGGCKKCNTLEKNTKEALEKLGYDTKIEKITDYGQITALGVISTPTLMVDGKAIVTGRVAKTKEILKLLG